MNAIFVLWIVVLLPQPRLFFQRYRDFSTGEVLLHGAFPSGGWAAGLSGEQDRFLRWGRRRLFLDLQYQLGGTEMAFYLLRGQEARPGFEGREDQAFFSLTRNLNFSPMSLFLRGQLHYARIRSPVGVLDNSGYTLLAVETPVSPFLPFLSLTLLGRKLNRGLRLEARHLIPTGAWGVLEIQAEGEDRRYRVSDYGEHLQVGQAHLRWEGGQGWGPLSVDWAGGLSGEVWRYTRSLFRSARRGHGQATLGLAFQMNRLRLEGRWRESRSVEDYLYHPADERFLGRALEGKGELLWGALDLFFSGQVELQRYDYPQGIRFDTRDRRALEFQTGARLSRFPGETRLVFRGRQADLVYVDPRRAGSTRNDRAYFLTGESWWETPVFFLGVRTEVAALYSIYRFHPENNLLSRYIELRVSGRSFSPWLRFSIQVRLLDRGAYRRDLQGLWRYGPSVVGRDLIGEGEIRTFRLLGFALLPYARYFIRRERRLEDREERTRSELEVGLRWVGQRLEGRIGWIRRNWEDRTFWRLELRSPLQEGGGERHEGSEGISGF